MVELKFEYDDEGLQTLIKNVKQVPPLVLKYMALEMFGELRKETPTDHGRLVGAWALEQQDELSWHIINGVEYALAVYSGTGSRGDTSLGASGHPFNIYPVHKKALYWPGADHPVKAVHHPGMPSNPYIDRAAETTRGRIDEFVSRAMNEIGVT